jgi:hypothetical protein
MEQSGCEDEFRRNANFQEFLRCYEVLSMAGVETIPRLLGPKLSYTKICYNILPHLLPSSPYRQHTKKYWSYKTLFPILRED